MRFSICITVGALAAPALSMVPRTPLGPDPPKLQRLQDQREESMRGIHDNIGNKAGQEVGPGLVVASPTKENPNYWYTWTRDSALTFKALLDDSLYHSTDAESLAREWVTAQAHLQTKANPSGDLCNGGLGETRFYVNGSVTHDDWPRPQRDGPALRIQAMVAFGNILIDKGHQPTVEKVIWPLVQNDAAYVSEFWNETTYDLWESVKSKSMFATAVQYRSLVEANRFAHRLGKDCEACRSQAPQILCFLQSFWTGTYMLANTEGDRSGKDVQTILASIHVYDPDAGCDATTFQPCSDRALLNHKTVVDSFRSLFPINAGARTGGIGVGRYPEDTYFNGNPWYLSNFGAAEQLYDAMQQWRRQGVITITATSLPFFQDLISTASVGTYGRQKSSDSGPAMYEKLITAVRKYADELMTFPPNVCLKCENPQQPGSMNEQFDRVDGKPISAKSLTWSNAAFITAMNARDGFFGPAWGAEDATRASVCQASSAKGACGLPTQMNFPDHWSN